MVSKHWPECVHHVSFPKYRPLKLLFSWEIVPKDGFCPPICKGKKIPPDFGHTS